MEFKEGGDKKALICIGEDAIRNGDVISCLTRALTTPTQVLDLNYKSLDSEFQNLINHFKSDFTKDSNPCSQLENGTQIQAQIVNAIAAFQNEQLIIQCDFAPQLICLLKNVLKNNGYEISILAISSFPFKTDQNFDAFGKLHYNILLEFFSRDISRFAIDYFEFIQYPRRDLQRAAKYLGFELNKDVVDDIFSIFPFLRNAKINMLKKENSASPTTLSIFNNLLISNLKANWTHPFQLQESIRAYEELRDFACQFEKPKEQNNYNLYTQLYMDKGKGFLGINSRIVKISGLKNNISFDLSQIEKISALKLKALNKMCALKNLNISLITKSNEIIRLPYRLHPTSEVEGIKFLNGNQLSIDINIGSYKQAIKKLIVQIDYQYSSPTFIGLLNKYNYAIPLIESLKEDVVVSKENGFNYHIDQCMVINDPNQKSMLIRGWAFNDHEIPKVRFKCKGFEHSDFFSPIRKDLKKVYKKRKDVESSGFMATFKVPENYLEEGQIIFDFENGSFSVVPEIKLIPHYRNLPLNLQYQFFMLFQEPPKYEDLEYNPKISVIVPVYNVKSKYLDACIESVINQHYQNWELCLFDDCSTKKSTRACLKKWEQYEDPRIKIDYGEENKNISAASNAAIALATGDYIALLDNDDELTVNALYEVAKAINEKPNLKFIYSDEDKIELDGTFGGPYFKSDFNIDLLRSNNYITHFTTIKKEVGASIGWFREGFEGAQDHDLFLRVVDTIDTEEIHHISKVLYHWRKIPSSTSMNYSSKSYAFKAGKRVIEEHLLRNNIEAKVSRGAFGGAYRINRKINEYKNVSIIIPFKDKVKYLRKLIPSIIKKTNYPNYEIILVSNNSEKEKTFKYIHQLQKKFHQVKFLEYNIPFNYSKINNWAIQQVDSEYILLLNNDMEVISKGWLGQLVQHIQRSEVGAVGAKLLYEDNTLQHAGLIMGLGGSAGHYQKGKKNGNHYFNMGVTKNVSGVTGACLMTRKDVYLELQGLDEDNLKVAFNDVDYCLKVIDAGYLIIYNPLSTLYHYESKSRGYDNDGEKQVRAFNERDFLQKKWGNKLFYDPLYNINLTLLDQLNSLKINERDIKNDFV